LTYYMRDVSIFNIYLSRRCGGTTASPSRVTSRVRIELAAIIRQVTILGGSKVR
jgi:hypothetical protein